MSSPLLEVKNLKKHFIQKKELLKPQLAPVLSVEVAPPIGTKCSSHICSRFPTSNRVRLFLLARLASWRMRTLTTVDTGYSKSDSWSCVEHALTMSFLAGCLPAKPPDH